MQFHIFDSLYLERLRAGDFRTQEHFVAYFTELLRLKLSKRLRCRTAIEDARQDTFTQVLIALRKEDGVRKPECFGAFVNSVCNNVVSKHYADLEKNCRPADPEAANHAAEALVNIPDPAPSVVDDIARRETQEKVRDILNDLSGKDRRLIEEIFFKERDKDEVCREMGVTREYFRVLLHRAIKSFKAFYLKKDGK